MAQLPTIASTANRRILPSADLKIEGATPAAFGAGIGAGLQQIGEAGQQAGAAMQQLALAKQQEEDRLAEFDRQTQFVNFGSDQSTKLTEASRDISGPAVDFTKTRMTGFDADAAAFLEKVPERFRPAWTARMAQLRSGVAGEALRTEFAQRDSYYKTTIGDTLGKLLNGAMSSPDKLDEWRAQGEEIINTSGLSAQDKLEYATRWKGQIGVAAAQGDLQRDPEGAMARLGGIDFIVETKDGGYASSTATYTKGGAATLKGDVINFFVGKGVPAHIARGIAAGIESESSGDHRAINDTSGAYGLGQWLGSRKAALFARYGNNPTREQQLEFLYSELRGGDAGGPAVLAAKDEGQAVDRYIRGFMRPGKDTESGIRRGMKALGYRVQEGAPAGEAGTVTTRTVGTGQVDPRYADIPIDARIQLIGAAEREIESRQREVKIAEAEQHDKWLNQFMTELNDGKAGMADIEAARKSGRLTDFDEIARAQNIVEAREKANADINAYTTLANTPGFQWNPYDDRQRKAVDAAVAAQGGTPQAAFNVWQKTGILGKAGGVALRGAMISTDPVVVQQAANIAGNMLRRNPNAFAAVEGGSEIESAALAFNHYVYDLGINPQQAAQRVAKENSPEYKAKVKIAEPQLQEYRAELRKKGATDTTSIFSGGRFPTAGAKRDADEAYAELVVDQLRAGHDMGSAKSIAAKQLQKVYGVSRGGRIVRYPPERGYAPLGDGPDKHAYVYRDAAATVKAERGVDVDPSKIILVPIRGVTDQDFRTGQPPRYRIVYSRTVDGQEVVDTVPGYFAADVKAEAKRIRTRREQQFKQERREAIAERPAPTLAEVRAANPRRDGEGTFAYSQRIGSLQWEAQRQRGENIKESRSSRLAAEPAVPGLLDAAMRDARRGPKY